MGEQKVKSKDEQNTQPVDKENGETVDMKRRAAFGKLAKLSGVGATTVVAVLTATRAKASSLPPG